MRSGSALQLDAIREITENRRFLGCSQHIADADDLCLPPQEPMSSDDGALGGLV